MQHEPRNEEPELDDIITLIDVDFYLSLRDFARFAGKTILMYTVIPSSIAGSSKESYWFINAEGVYEEHVNGGACYKHQVWDYSSDIVIVPRTFSFTTYHSHIVPGDGNRALVALAPISTVYLPLWFVSVMYTLLHGVPFKATIFGRTKNVMRHGDFISCSYQSVNEVWISIRKHGVNCEHAVDIPLRVWNAIRYFAHTSKIVGVSGVQRILKDNDITINDSAGLTILAEASNFPIVALNPVNFTLDRGKLDSLPGVATLAATPFVDPASMPNGDDFNVAEGLRTRIFDVKNQVKPSKQFYGYFREFNKLMVPDDTAHLTPNCYDATMASMAKTEAQWKRLFHDAGFLISEKDQELNAFVKSEVVNGAGEGKKPSRLIFPVAQKLLVTLGRFVQPAKDYLMNNLSFWSVGKKPDDIARSVCDFAKLGDIVETDYSKMDGTISPFLRDQYEYFLKRMFHKNQRPDLGDALKKHRDLKVRTPIGKTFRSGSMNPSGSSDTTPLNTYVNASVDYVAQREAGYSIADSFARIGPKFGDDGLCLAGPDYLAAASALGLKLKCVDVKCGEPVSFLSRVYVSPTLSLTSIAEPLRALGRIPVTTNADPIVGLTNKVNGYLITESKVPLIGNYLRALSRVYKLGKPNRRKATNDEVFKLDATPHPFDESFLDATITVVAQRLGICEGEVAALAKAFDDVHNTEDLAKLSRAENFRELGEDVIWLNDRPKNKIK